MLIGKYTAVPVVYCSAVDSSSLESQLQLFAAVGHEGLALQASGASGTPIRIPLGPAEPPDQIVSLTKEGLQVDLLAGLRIFAWRRS